MDLKELAAKLDGARIDLGMVGIHLALLANRMRSPSESDENWDDMMKEFDKEIEAFGKAADIVQDVHKQLSSGCPSLS